MIQNRKRKLKKRVGVAGYRTCALALSAAMIMQTGAIMAYADEVPAALLRMVRAAGDRDINTSSDFDATGIEDSTLRYAGVTYQGIQDGNIHLFVTRWLDLNGAGEFRTDKSNQFAGKLLLQFSDREFYSQIQDILIEGKSMEREVKADGALWMHPLSNFALGGIGVVANYDVEIKLKNGQTLDSLGMADREIDFTTVWVKNNGAIARESVSNGVILKNNSNGGENIEYDDAREAFMRGRMTQRILFDFQGMQIKSIHTFKPNENFLQTGYNWTAYIKEQVPKELLPYLDTSHIEIFHSDEDGVWKDYGGAIGKRKKFTIPTTEDGLVDTSNVPELSILTNNTKEQLKEARDNCNEIFWGTLGQSRSYTIAYPLKKDVALTDFAKAMNDYIKKHNERMRFEHWVVSDYLDENTSTGDGGAAPKRIRNSYSTAFVNTNDSDQDGVFDFIEWEIGTNVRSVDTDGDGVPDGQEMLDDHTDPSNAANYLVQKPTTETKSFDTAKEVIINGAVPKPLIADPSDPGKKLAVTDERAGNVIVKLHAYDKAAKAEVENEVYGEVKIPFKDLLEGKFSMKLPANSVPDKKDVVLVAYSPDCAEKVLGDPFVYTVADNSKYDAAGGELIKDYGQTAAADEIIGKVTFTPEAPAEAVKSKEVLGNIPTTGIDNQVKVKITYADDTTDEVTVKLSYKTAAESFDPKGTPVSTELNKEPSAEAGIANKNELPAGTKYTWKTPVDTKTPGQKDGTIVVTYPDGTTDEVAVKVSVADNRKDNEKYDPKGQAVSTELNKEPSAEAGIANKNELPAGTKYTWKTPVDTKTPGQKDGTIVVTYPDGTTDEVAVKVSVADNRADKEKYTA